VRGLVVDAGNHRVVDVVIRHGRTDELVHWEDLSSFGPDAVMVSSSSALRAPQSEEEKADSAGRRDPLGKQLLNDQGNGAGKVREATFDEETGVLQTITGDTAEVDAARIRGIGSYAVVVEASNEAA
jgi:uncharacterized protein YrrD